MTKGHFYVSREAQLTNYQLYLHNPDLRSHGFLNCFNCLRLQTWESFVQSVSITHGVKSNPAVCRTPDNIQRTRSARRREVGEEKKADPFNFFGALPGLKDRGWFESPGNGVLQVAKNHFCFSALCQIHSPGSDAHRGVRKVKPVTPTIQLQHQAKCAAEKQQRSGHAQRHHIPQPKGKILVVLQQISRVSPISNQITFGCHGDEFLLHLRNPSSLLPTC